LCEKGFPPAEIEAAISLANYGTVDECVLHLERIQEIATPDPILHILLGMGYDASIVRTAIARVGNSSGQETRTRVATLDDPPPFL
jgi:hypothetical protein